MEYIDWAKLIGGWFFSWPVAALLIVWVLRVELKVWLSEAKRVKAGPFEVERELRAVAAAGKIALDSVSQVILLLGESRLTELQLTVSGPTGMLLSEDGVKKLSADMSKLEALLKKVKSETIQEIELVHAKADLGPGS